MFRQVYLLLSFITILGLFSCSPSKHIQSPNTSSFNAQKYVNDYKDIAVSEMKRTGIPASITLAQGMIESNFGKSSLATGANNHFGIKCHNDWKGATVRHDDDKKNECFRKYSRPEDSFYDHSDFLRTGSRYGFLFEISSTDYKAWARGLKKAGYATNPDYANMLIRKIEENNLHYLDQGLNIEQKEITETVPENREPVNQDIENPAGNVNSVNGNFTVSERTQRIMENNRIKYIIVKDGETLESIEKEFQLIKWELTRYNEVSTDFSPVPGQMLYIQPKRDKAEPGKETHIVAEGDTMYSISQKYGVKIKKLYEYNRYQDGEEPVTGDKIWLRMIKQVN